MTLQPLGGSSREQSFMYWGERKEWLVGLWQNRDSDALERSNWRVIVPAMLKQFPEDAATETFNNWAVGWTEALLVRPGTAAAEAAQAWADKLANYPVADEDDYGTLEFDEEWCVRCDRGTREQHPIMDRNGNMCPFRDKDQADEIRWRWTNRHTEAA